MSYCKHYSRIAISDTGQKVLLVRLRCKRWSCDYCEKKNRQMWRAHLHQKMPKIGGNWSFLTITAMGENHRNSTTLEVLTGSWDRLMKRLKRYFGSFEYVRVYEQHASGEFHAHLLISHVPEDVVDSNAWKFIRVRNGLVWSMRKAYRGTGYQKLRDASIAVGLGEITDFAPLVGENGDFFDVIHVVRYVTKYMSKNLANMPKHTRRIQCSSRIGGLKNETNPDWQVRDSVSWSIVASCDVYDLDKKVAVSIDDLGEYGYYPNPLDKVD